jgi:disulfide bond formation protein DsbB
VAGKLKAVLCLRQRGAMYMFVILFIVSRAIRIVLIVLPPSCRT